MEDPLAQLPARLRAAREACGMTQADVAKALGVTAAAVSYLESGARRVSSVQLTRLARLFGRAPQDFLAQAFEPGSALAALFRTELSEEARPDLLEAGRRCLELARAETWLEDKLEVPRRTWRAESRRARPAPTRVMQAVEEGEEAAETERQRLGLGRHPLPDLMGLLEDQGVRTALLQLPESVDGLTLAPTGMGVFVAVNQAQKHSRRRFSFAHEYGHVLLDTPSDGIVSWRGNLKDLRETRANAFAAAFLMPAGGVRDYVSSLGRSPRQGHTEVFDGNEVTRYRLRPDPNSSRIQPGDVIHLAWHFGVSPLAAVFRLKNLGLITESERDELQAADARGDFARIRSLLGLEEPDTGHDEPLAFQHRFLALVTETLRRGEVTWARGRKLAVLAGMSEERFERYCEQIGLEPEPTDAILPEAEE